uniref:VWFA domain-containing protein n=1 Tax=Romanomermis culicivorax TaxID=13658 RepID=A0A915HNW2_ROMCU
MRVFQDHNNFGSFSALLILASCFNVSKIISPEKIEPASLMLQNKCRLSYSGLPYKLCESALRMKEPRFTPRNFSQTTIEQVTALTKPWFPIWNTDMKNCINKVRVDDLHLDKGQKTGGRKMVVLLITDEAVDEMEGTVQAIKQLQDEGVSFFMILTTKGDPNKSGISKQLGKDSVVEAVRKAGADDRVANKLVEDVCSRTCSTDEKEVESCTWDKNSNCVRKPQSNHTKVLSPESHENSTILLCKVYGFKKKALEPDHPACKSFRASNRTLPCPIPECKRACGNFKWSPWDQTCCGPDKGQKKQLARNRTIPDKVFHPTMCPRVDTFLCVVEYTCDEMLLHAKAAEEQRNKGWYLICIVLMIILFILAIIALCFLLTSRRRSADRFQRRLKAVGVLADLPLFSSSYRAPSSRDTDLGVMGAAGKKKSAAGGDPSDHKIRSAKRQDPSDKKLTKKL